MWHIDCLASYIHITLLRTLRVPFRSEQVVSVAQNYHVIYVVHCFEQLEFLAHKFGVIYVAYNFEQVVS